MEDVFRNGETLILCSCRVQVVRALYQATKMMIVEYLDWFATVDVNKPECGYVFLDSAASYLSLTFQVAAEGSLHNPRTQGLT